MQDCVPDKSGLTRLPGVKAKKRISPGFPFKFVLDFLQNLPDIWENRQFRIVRINLANMNYTFVKVDASF